MLIQLILLKFNNEPLSVLQHFILYLYGQCSDKGEPGLVYCVKRLFFHLSHEC